MKLCIDTEILKQSNLTPDVVMSILALYLGNPIKFTTFQNVCKTGFIEYEKLDVYRNPINLQLSECGIEFVESLILNSEFKTKGESKDRFDLLAEKLRELYPKGKKDGTPYMWRDSNTIIAKRLKTIVKKYGDNFTDEQAINATKKYIESFNGNYKFMQLLKYFINKRVSINGEIEERSDFLSYIENAGQEEDLNNDWTTNLI